MGHFDGRGMFEVNKLWSLNFCLEVERERMCFGRDDRMRNWLVLRRGEELFV